MAATLCAQAEPAELASEIVSESASAPGDVVPDDLARELLRLEFDAIIAAGFRPAADQPHPVPPARRVGTVVGAARPSVRSARGGRAALPGRRGPVATVGTVPRERGPPDPDRGRAALSRH